MPPQTYRDQFLKLIDKGYLVHKGCNRYDFYEKPLHLMKTIDGFYTETKPKAVAVNASSVDNAPTDNIEINKDNINIGRLEKQVSPTPQFVF